ncbi:hypothetical protein [Amycolatopsis sp. QT-25]|uniref:MmyB family transcriptional regulator n=1 Tax=Amycolatopsis sp. QT-25 TaxID=3034022 RepID=UPI003208E5E5
MPTVRGHPASLTTMPLTAVVGDDDRIVDATLPDRGMGTGLPAGGLDQAWAGAGLRCRDEEFARLWAGRDVKVNGRGRKVIRHPDVGELAVHFETLTPLQDPDQLLVSYRAADDESQSALDRLCTR